MAVFNKFNVFVQNLGLGVHNFSTNVLKAALTNALPVATNTVLANITQIATAGGYTGGAGGGMALDGVTFVNAVGVSKLTIVDEVFTAAASVGPFRYVVIYDDTSASDSLIGWYDYGSAITLNTSETLTIDFDATNGVLTLA